MSHNANDILDPERFGLITGSKCEVLFPKKSAEVGQRNYAIELANQMYWRYYDDIGSWQMEHGNNCEPMAFDYYFTHFDSKAEYKPKFKHIENWGGSADCLSPEWGTDFKCPTTLKAWLDYLYYGINDQQKHQAQMYMFLYDRPLWKICAYLQETDKMANEGETYPVPEDKRMILIDVIRDPVWEIALRAITPKIITMRDEFLKVLIKEFGEMPKKDLPF